MSSKGESTQVVVFALLSNLGIALAKFGGAYFSQSAAMLAEAVHSVVDTLNQALLLFGNRRAQKPPSDLHPLGYGREAFFWPFIVAILLFSLGGVFAIHEGIEKASHAHEVAAPWVALFILGVSLILESFSFYACLRQVIHEKKGMTFYRWFRTTSSADLLVVLAEDSAALVGLILAAVFLGLAAWTGNPIWDAVGSIFVGIVLIVVAVFLAVETQSLLIGEAASQDFKPFLDQEIQKCLPGGRLLRVVALQLGAQEILLSIKIHPGEVATASGLIEGINALELATKREFPQVRWQFVEPDYFD